MNSVLAINALNSENSIENNILRPVDGGVSDAASELNNELFDGEFSELLNDLVSSDGKIEPLDVAALKELNLNQLQGLVNLEHASGSPKLKQLSGLGLSANIEDTQIGNAELYGNPELNALLDRSFIKNEIANEELLITKDVNKSGLLKVITTSSDEFMHSMLNKDADLSKLLEDVNLTQRFKGTNKADLDFASELLGQSARQESNATKLADQLASMDKSINPINQSNTQSLKSYSGLEQTGKVMNRIEVPVNQAGWGEAVGNRLMIMVNGKMQSANIHLNPAELGPIEIRVSVNQDQTTVNFISNNAVVRDAIEEAFPRLKEMFSQNGLSLADANVSQQSQNQSSQQSEKSNSEDNQASIISNNGSLEDLDANPIIENRINIGLINQYV